MALEIRGMSPLLQVFDMPLSIQFYRDILGFSIAEQSQPGQGDDCDWVLLKLNEIEIMLNTAYEKPDRPPKPDGFRVAAHCDTAIYFGCPDIEAAYRYLSTKGLAVNKPVVTGYGFLALYLTDPDGFVITLHWPVLP